MKKIIVILLGCLAVSCGNNDSLQKYFVESSEKPNFTQLDISLSNFIDRNILKEDEEQLLEVVKKINVLLYHKKDEINYHSELERVNRILKNDKFEDLIRFNFKKVKGKITVIGDYAEVDELVIMLSNTQKGFVLARVLGKNITPENLYSLSILMKDNSKLQKKIEDFLP